jgi:hypothetical protein
VESRTYTLEFAQSRSVPRSGVALDANLGYEAPSTSPDSCYSGKKMAAFFWRGAHFNWSFQLVVSIDRYAQNTGTLQEGGFRVWLKAGIDSADFLP